MFSILLSFLQRYKKARNLFSPWRFFDLGGHRHIPLGHIPQTLVVVQVLFDGSDGTLLTGLTVLPRGQETTLNHLLLEDIEDVPQGVTLVLGTHRGEEVIDGLVIDIHLILCGVALANLVSLDGQFTLLLVGEDGGVHRVHLVDGSRNLIHNLSDNTTEFLEGIVDVADGEICELGISDHHAIRANKPVAPHHETEGIESIVAVLDDDADLGLDITVLVNDIGPGVCGFHSQHVEGTDATGTLLVTALLGLHGIPPESCHVVDYGFSVGIGVLFGNTRIGRSLGKGIGALGTNIVHRHRGHLIGQGNHSIHILLCFCLTIQR